MTSTTYGKAREAWEHLQPGDVVSAPQLAKLSGVKRAKNVSSFLSQMLRRGLAIKDGKNDGKLCYKKVGIVEPTPKRDLLNEAQVGRSIIDLIFQLRDEIHRQRSELHDEKLVVKELVEENHKLKELYDQAQQRILELNSSNNGMKSIKLHEIQELVTSH